LTVRLAAVLLHANMRLVPAGEQDQDTRVEAAAAPTTHAALRLPCTVTVEHHRLSSSPMRPPWEVAREAPREVDGRHVHGMRPTIGRWEVEKTKRAVCPQTFLERYTSSYLHEWEAFVDAVRSGGPSPVPGAAGRAALVIALAATRSLNEERGVRVGEIS
jgi:predicted dehydrogenase